MSNSADMAQRKRVLDPVERISEVIFGVLMALSFTGALSVATAGREEVRTMMLTALGCNLAWGLTDAVMYLVGTVVERSRKVALLRQLVEATSGEEAHRLIREALPERLSAAAEPAALEVLRQRLTAAALPRPGLVRDDWAAALEVFGLVVFATFPVVIPFVFVHESAIALRISNALAVATLFAGGYILGRYAESSPWRFGLAMAAVGTVLVAVIIALGG
ncbi:MAG TPA: VIT1/CCC1 transporter family protein [Burkholderiales bacterium]|nr:VIT1/CCC1 transporter family protein [Burkholderiales bacterium]